MRKPTAKSVEEVNIYLEGLGLGTADNGNLTRDGNLSVERTGGDVMLQVKTISSGNPYINISGASDQYITWQYSDVTKFAVRTTASDWRLYVADDAGSIWSGHTWVFGVNRSTGLITAKNGIAIGDAGPQMLSGALGPSGVQAPVGSTYRQTAANSSHGNLAGLLWNKVGTGTAEGTDWLVDYEGRWVSYTPTITASGGTFTTVSGSGSSYTRQGKTAMLRVKIVVTTVGTATGAIIFTLPSGVNANADWMGWGRQETGTGYMLQVRRASSTTGEVYKYDNTTAIAAQTNVVHFNYEIA